MSLESIFASDLLGDLRKITSSPGPSGLIRKMILLEQISVFQTSSWSPLCSSEPFLGSLVFKMEMAFCQIRPQHPGPEERVS